MIKVHYVQLIIHNEQKLKQYLNMWNYMRDQSMIYISNTRNFIIYVQFVSYMELDFQFFFH